MHSYSFSISYYLTIFSLIFKYDLGLFLVINFTIGYVKSITNYLNLFFSICFKYTSSAALWTSSLLDFAPVSFLWCIQKHWGLLVSVFESCLFDLIIIFHDVSRPLPYPEHCHWVILSITLLKSGGQTWGKLSVQSHQGINEYSFLTSLMSFTGVIFCGDRRGNKVLSFL